MVVMNIALCSSDYAGNILDSFSYLLKTEFGSDCTGPFLAWKMTYTLVYDIFLHYILVDICKR